MLLFHAKNDFPAGYDVWWEGVYAYPTEEECHAFLQRERGHDHKGFFTLRLLGEAVAGVVAGPILEDFNPG